MTKSVCAAWADGRVSAGFCGVATNGPYPGDAPYASAADAYANKFHAVSNNLGAAVAAGVEENACDPVLAPDGDERCLRRISGDITPRFGNGGRWAKRSRSAAHHLG